MKINESEKNRILSLYYNKPINEQEEGDPKECLDEYISFLLKPSAQDGDLKYWNDDKIPDLEDEDAFNRFLDYLRQFTDPTYSKFQYFLFEDLECENVTFKDIEPFVKDRYLTKLKEIHSKSTKPNDGESIKDSKKITFQDVLDVANDIEQSGYSDPFDWMNAVFSDLEFDYDIEDESLRDKYGDVLMDYFTGG